MRPVRFLLAALLLAPLFACATASVLRTVERSPPRLVFTTGIENGKPVDEIETLAGKHPKLCLSGRWFDLPSVPLAYRFELRDGRSRVAYVGEMVIRPTRATWFTWSCYSRTRADAPGIWTYTLKLGDAEMVGQIDVEEQPRRAKVFGVGLLGALDPGGFGALGGLIGAELPTQEIATRRVRRALAACVEEHRGEAIPTAISFTVHSDGSLGDIEADGEGELARCLERAMEGVVLNGTPEPSRVRIPLRPRTEPEVE